jgi:hypothetical protein
MNDGLSREKALAAAIDYVVAVFPTHLTIDGVKTR